MRAERNEGRKPRPPRKPQTKSIRAGEILFGKEKNKNQLGEYRLGSGSRGGRGFPLISAAARAFHAATLLGLRMSVHDGFIEWEAEREPPVSLLCHIGDHKPELIQILRGDACRTCGAALAWPKALGLVFADGTAECMRCCDDEVERLLAARRRAVNPALAPDPAEVMLRGEVA
jgi:hypothetical protein